MACEATIETTTNGVKHITADDYRSLGYGQAWACAPDHLGIICDQVLKVRSERSRHFGAGSSEEHLNSDFGYKTLGLIEIAMDQFGSQCQEISDLLEGYSAGFADFLLDGGRDLLPRWCRDAPWISAPTPEEILAIQLDLALAAGSRIVAPFAGCALPPGPDGPNPPPDASLQGMGSNGWAIGSELSASRSGMVVGQPHFPWHGEARLWECPITIPGELDAYGATLIGVPLVLIGFTNAAAWTHTFSIGNRLILYKLDTEDGIPTRYRLGEEHLDMTPTTYTVEVNASGEPSGESPEVLETVTRTLYRSHLGPMLNLPVLGWTNDWAATYSDANTDNLRITEQWLEMNRATSAAEFKDAFVSVDGVPWANTLAAFPDGACFYVDASSTANISEAAAEAFRVAVKEDPLTALLYSNRAALLDGSDPNAQPDGLIPPAHHPRLERHDFVSNSNNTHWCTNPNELLTGFSPLVGLECEPLSLRARQCIKHITRQGSGAAGRLTLEEMVLRMMSTESLSADLLLSDVVEMCNGEHTLAEAVGVLRNWDRCFGIQSVGAALWREFMGAFADTDLLGESVLFSTPFDPDNPIETPCGPIPESSTARVRSALSDAAEALGKAGVALTAKLGDHQWTQQDTHRIEVPGGNEADGVVDALSPLEVLPSTSRQPKPERQVDIANRLAKTGLGPGGYLVRYGSTFTFGVEFTPDGPRALANMAYSQSDNPESEHFIDGTLAYSRSEFRQVAFTRAEIESDSNYYVVTVMAPDGSD